MKLSIGIFDENGEEREVRTFSIDGDRDHAFAFAQGVMEEIHQSVPSVMFAIKVLPG